MGLQRRKNTEERVKTAIARLQMASDMAIRYTDQPLYVCISGGKDSSVLQQLAIEAGIDCIFHHSHTTLDAPTTVYFIREEFERLRKLGYRTIIRYPELSMWKLIEKKKGFLPLRISRYCCGYFKERPITSEVDGKPVFIATGVRWSESSARKGRGDFEVIASTRQKGERILANDNDLERKLFEDCKLKGERVVNPIIDWEEYDIWNFIKDRKIPYNQLYDLGFKRVGCICCPMSSPKMNERLLEMWPKYRDAFIRAIDKGTKIKLVEGGSVLYTSAEERFNDWLRGGKSL